MVSAYLFIEGGANGPHSKEISIRCQKAFHTLLDRMGFAGRKPRLVACGGRNAVYEHFCTEHGKQGVGYVAMWIDSEDPMRDIEAAWAHLASTTTVDKWERPSNATDEQVLFMTTCMETLIVADRTTLRTYFGQHLKENALPTIVAVESKLRHDIQRQLKLATQDCPNAYIKGKHSYDVLQALQPQALSQHLPSFARVERILSDRLK